MPNLNNRPKNSPNFKQLLNNTPGANTQSLIKQFINHQYSELFYLNIVHSGKICSQSGDLQLRISHETVVNICKFPSVYSLNVVHVI